MSPSPIFKINESHLGKMARREHAEALMKKLRRKAWRVAYTKETRPEWKFENLAQYRRFMIAYQIAVNELFYDEFTFPIFWNCPCKEGQAQPCPHGEDPLTPTPRFPNLPDLGRCAMCGRFFAKRRRSEGE